MCFKNTKNKLIFKNSYKISLDWSLQRAFKNFKNIDNLRKKFTCYNNPEDTVVHSKKIYATGKIQYCLH